MIIENPIEINDVIGFIRNYLGFPAHGPYGSHYVGTSQKHSQDQVETCVPALQTLCLQSKRAPVPPPSLDGLPAELLEHVAMDLPVTSILALRRSSKRLYFGISLDNLFWRRVLLSNRLFGFTWDLDSQMSTDDDLAERNSTEALKWDWRGLAIALSGDRPVGRKGSLRLNEPIGLTRRRNIWDNIRMTELKMSRRRFGGQNPRTCRNYWCS